MALRIAKIKHRPAGWEIHMEERRGKEEKDTIFRCSDTAHTDLDLSFDALVGLAREILQLPAEWKPNSMTICGVSFSFSEETQVEGAVLTGLVDLDTSNAPFCFNTPHLAFEQYSETGEAPLMPQRGIELLAKVRMEAELYMSGKKRAQLQLAI